MEGFELRAMKFVIHRFMMRNEEEEIICQVLRLLKREI